MKGTIDFKYDAVNDLVIATPRWKLETQADVQAWFQQYVDFMTPFRRKMDLVAVLDFFEIAPAIGPFWGDFRARVHQQFTRHSYRVHSNNRVKLFVNTSGVRYNVATQEAATIEDAIEGIKAARLVD